MPAEPQNEVWKLAERMMKDVGYISIWSASREVRESYIQRALRATKERAGETNDRTPPETL